MIRILIADDHPVVRTGLQGMLTGEADLEVVGEATDGQEALDKAVLLLPDVVLMDLRMPNLDGVGATERIRSRLPATQVLILTTYDTDGDILRAIDAGAVGCLLKDAPREAAGEPAQPRRVLPRRAPKHSDMLSSPRAPMARRAWASWPASHPSLTNERRPSSR